MPIDLSKLYPAPTITTTGPALKSGVYVEGWWSMGSNKHVNPTYSSFDPATVVEQADLMQSCGISMVNHTFYGVRETNILNSAKAWAAETAKRGMGFSIMLVNDMLNGITTDPTQYVIADLKQSGLLDAPSYIPEKAIWDFGVSKSIDAAKLLAALPGFTLWREHLDYTWINAPGTPEQQVAYERTQRANGRLKAPSIWYQFNDANPADPTHSIWGGSARRVDSNRGNLWLDLCGLAVPASAKYMMYGTWDDYEEGTAIEGMLAAMNGRKIS